MARQDIRLDIQSDTGAAQGNVPNAAQRARGPVWSLQQTMKDLEHAGIDVSPELRAKLSMIAESSTQLKGCGGINRALFLKQLATRAIDPGMRTQGLDMGFCHNSNLIEGLSGTEYLEHVCDLVLNGSTTLRSGVTISLPAGYSFSEGHSDLPYQQLVACDAVFMTALDYYCMKGVRAVGSGLYAREAERGQEALTGRQATVVYGLAAAVAAMGRAKEGRATIMSVQWSQNGDHGNHSIILAGTNGKHSRIYNPWGTPFKDHTDLSGEGMNSRMVIRNGRSGQEDVNTSEIADKTNYALIGNETGAVERTEITDAIAGNLGYKNREEVARAIEQQNAELGQKAGIPIDNVRIERTPDGRIFLVVDTKVDLAKDLSQSLDMGLTKPLFFFVNFSLKREEEKRRDRQAEDDKKRLDIGDKEQKDFEKVLYAESKDAPK